MEKKRYLSFDLVKLIAISWIVVIHIYFEIYYNFDVFNLKSWHSIIYRPNLNTATTAVTLFVIISGITLAISSSSLFDEKLTLKNVFTFYKKRVLKILVPYYIAYIMVYMYTVILSKNINIMQDVPFIAHILTPFGMDGYVTQFGYKSYYMNVGEWFLGCIFLCYIVCPFLIYFQKKYKKQTIITMIILFILIMTFYNFNESKHMNFRFQVFNFYIGILLVEENVFEKIKKLKNKKYIIPIIVFLILLYLCFSTEPLNIEYNYITTITSVLIILAFFTFEDNLNKNKYLVKFINLYNVYSYEIFLVHHFVLTRSAFMIYPNHILRGQFAHLLVTDFMWMILLSMIIKFANKILFLFFDKLKRGKNNV